MSTTTAKEILIAARAKLALMATSRDGSILFIEHKTSQPFEKSPVSKRDGFEIVMVEKELTKAFGITGVKEEQRKMVVKLGHSPFAKDDVREENLSRDIDRIGDVFESYAWPAGTEAMWYESASTNKDEPNWWITELVFRVLFLSAIETS